MKRRRNIFAGVGVAALIVIAGYVAVPDSKKPYTYDCLYKEGSTYARCLGTPTNPGGCYGYYDLLGDSPKDGIKTNAGRAATCEGIVDGKTIHFDSQGRFVQ